MGRLYVLLDCLMMLVFLFSVLWLRTFETVENNKVHRRHLTVELYTVQVYGIPPKASEEDIYQHFSNATRGASCTGDHRT